MRGGPLRFAGWVTWARYVWSTTVGGKLVCRASAGPRSSMEHRVGVDLNTCS
jgi:hypothetical protein